MTEDRWIQLATNVTAPDWRDATQGHEGGANPSPQEESVPEGSPVAVMPGLGGEWKDATPGGTTVPPAVVLNERLQGGPPPETDLMIADRIPPMEGYVECPECHDVVKDGMMSGQNITCLEAHKQSKHREGSARDIKRMTKAAQTDEAKAKRTAGLKEYWRKVKAGEIERKGRK